MASEASGYTLVQHLVMLAKEVAKGSGLDSSRDIDLDDLFTRTAESVLERYLMHSAEERDELMLASLIYLVVENCILNVKLMQQY